MGKTIIKVGPGGRVYQQIKSPAETHVAVALDFSDVLLADEEIEEVSVDDVETGVISSAAAVGQAVELILTGGENGSKIVTQITVTGSAGNIRQATLVVVVRDPAHQVAGVVLASVLVARDAALAAQVAAELAQQEAEGAAGIAGQERIAAQTARAGAEAAQGLAEEAARLAGQERVAAQAARAGAEAAQGLAEEAAGIAGQERVAAQVARAGAEAAQLAAETAEAGAAAAASGAVATTNAALVSVAADLLRTQTIIVEHHAFS
jgi:hypothetical protein